MTRRHKHKRTTDSLQPSGIFIAGENGTRKRYRTKRGTPNKRIVANHTDDKRDYFLHATKGYRSYAKAAVPISANSATSPRSMAVSRDTKRQNRFAPS